MKNTGIVRNLDQLGRITLPKEMRRVLDIKEGDPIEIWTENNSVVLKKYGNKDECMACGSTENVVIADGIAICKKCASKVIEIFR